MFIEANFSRLRYTVEDAANGDSIFVVKQRISPVTTSTDWKKKTIQASTTGVDLENWSRGTVTLENHIAQYQEKDNDPIYSVSHFTLPFKCIKKIEEKDTFQCLTLRTALLGLPSIFGTLTSPVARMFLSRSPARSSSFRLLRLLHYSCCTPFFEKKCCPFLATMDQLIAMYCNKLEQSIPCTSHCLIVYF